ncbi:MAG: M50 family metallopeptidase [Candidatus Levyibacteriota bacterium]
MLVTIIVFLLILSVLVLIHEAGHFFVAKFFGIKVDEFGFGLPPRIFGKKFGETLYSINWLPIGGFVKLYGEDEAGAGRVSLSKKASRDTIESKSYSMKERETLTSSKNTLIEEEEIEISEKITIEGRSKDNDPSRAFFAKPVWERALVIFAGVFMNFVLAVAIISVLFSVVGVQTPGNKVIVDTVVKGAPADKAGLKVGDIIVSVNNIQVTTSEQLQQYTDAHAGEKLALEVKSQNSNVENIEVTPRKVYPSNEGPMGIGIEQNVILKKYPWYQAPFVGTWEALQQSWLIVSGLVMLVIQLFTKGVVPQGVAGPIGIAQLTGVVISIGPAAVLSLVSLLSLNLAIINILPIPALDGGRLFFILVEGIFGKKVNQELEARAHMIGMIVLLALIALITLHDLYRILTGQPIIPK